MNKQTIIEQLEKIVEEEVSNYGSSFSPTMVSKIVKMVDSVIKETQRETRKEEQDKLKAHVVLCGWSKKSTFPDSKMAGSCHAEWFINMLSQPKE